MTVHENEYYKDKLAQAILEIQGMLYTCTFGCRQWTGSKHETTLDPVDGSLCCPRCGEFTTEYTEHLLPKMRRDELFLENTSYLD